MASKNDSSDAQQLENIVGLPTSLLRQLESEVLTVEDYTLSPKRDCGFTFIYLKPDLVLYCIGSTLTRRR